MGITKGKRIFKAKVLRESINLRFPEGVDKVKTSSEMKDIDNFKNAVMFVVANNKDYVSI